MIIIVINKHFPLHEKKRKGKLIWRESKMLPPAAALGGFMADTSVFLFSDLISKHWCRVSWISVETVSQALLKRSLILGLKLVKLGCFR